MKETIEELLMMTHAQYCRSEHWKEVCKAVRIRDKGRCILCNRTAIQFHHRSYVWKGVYHKEIQDVVSLCKRCHNLFHDNVKIKSSSGWEETDLIKNQDGTFSKNTIR